MTTHGTIELVHDFHVRRACGQLSRGILIANVSLRLTLVDVSCIREVDT
jgi:hypothetical protein